MHSPRAQCDKKAYQFLAKLTVEQPGEPHAPPGDGRGDPGRRRTASPACAAGAACVPRPRPSSSPPARSSRRSMHTGEVRPPAAAPATSARRALGESPGARLRAQAVQDRHAAPAEWPDHRLLPARAPAGRRRPVAVLVPDRPDRPSRSSIATSPTTNPAVHDVIRANLHRAPMYSGQIQSTGPRYCPSIEDKVVRFADRDEHQIFLEPEGAIRWNTTATASPPACRATCRRRSSR